MKKYIVLFSILAVIISCNSSDSKTEVHLADWTENVVSPELYGDSKSQYTYVPIYSRIYTRSSKETRLVTASVTIHNMNLKDSIFIINADYYDNSGDLVRSYIQEPILLTSMQTIDIVINERDNEGGTGANFLIEWKKNNDNANAPLAEALMISTNGQQGVSFTSRGVILNTPNE